MRWALNSIAGVVVAGIGQYLQAAHVLMHHGHWSSLRSWTMRIAKRRSLKPVKVALARKLVVVMHRIWSDGIGFSWSDARDPDAPRAAA